MAQLLQLDTFSSGSGDLTVFEKLLPGPIRRVFYLHALEERHHTGQRHRKAWHALICLNGSCRIDTYDGERESRFVLDNPQNCLLLSPKDWYALEELTPGAFLLILSNEYHDPEDVIEGPYPRTEGSAGGPG